MEFIISFFTGPHCNLHALTKSLEALLVKWMLSTRPQGASKAIKLRISWGRTEKQSRIGWKETSKKIVGQMLEQILVGYLHTSHPPLQRLPFVCGALRDSVIEAKPTLSVLILVRTLSQKLGDLLSRLSAATHSFVTPKSFNVSWVLAFSSIK